MNSDTRIHRLPNGLRLATVEMPHMESVGIGIWTEAGSRHEHSDEHGMAHFVEHLLFKGTTGRTGHEISRQAERSGASLDAFTVEDHTCYHARCPAESAIDLLDVMSDLYQNPQFDPEEMEAEKQVIREEIAMVHDQPAQLLEDLVSEATWGAQHPLGRSITGTEESLDSHSEAKVRQFFERCYHAGVSVVSVAGNIDHEQISEAVMDRFGHLAAGSPLEEIPADAPRFATSFQEMNDLEQAHLALAFRAADRHDPDRFSQKILSVILGENMSSRLFQRIREEMGLCYEIQSENVSFSDAGVLQIYLALDPDNLDEALEAVQQIIVELKQSPPGQEELEEAISYCIGQSKIHLESVTSQTMWAGECLLSFDEWIDPQTVREKLAVVTREQVQASAQTLFQPNRSTFSLVGPQKAIAVSRQQLPFKL